MVQGKIKKAKTNINPIPVKTVLKFTCFLSSEMAHVRKRKTNRPAKLTRLYKIHMDFILKAK